MADPLEVYDRHHLEYSDIGLHLDWLRDLARGIVLEIGVRSGISTSALLLGVAHHGGHVYSIDIDDCSSLYPTFGENTPYWTFIQAHSAHDHERILNEMGRRNDSFQIDLLLLDGDHSYDGCMSDLTTYGPYSKVIAVHDTNSNYLGVWGSLLSYFRSPHNGGFISMEVRNASHGMGVIRR